MTRRRWTAWLLTLPALLIVVVLLVFPVLDTLLGSLTPLASAPARFAAFFADGYNRTVVFRTIEIALITTVLSLILGFVAALYISRCPPRYRNILLIVAIFPLLTNAVVRSFAWIAIIGRNGVANQLLLNLGVIDTPMQMLFTKFAIVVGLVYLFTPLAILALVGVLSAIDDDVLDASASLGASPFRVFTQVVFPLAIPGLIVGGVLVFTGSLAAFATARLLGGSRQMILPTFLYEKAIVSFDWDAASIIATIMVVIAVTTVLAMNALGRRFNPGM